MSNGTYQRIICFGDTLPLLDKYFSIKEDECEQTYWKTKDGDGDSTRSEIVLSVGPTIGALYPGDTQD